jgi:hypothetical protein
MRRFASCLLSVFGLCIAACAAEPASSASASRVMVKLVQPSDDPQLIARQASAASGVPVQYLAAASPQWHSLRLQCADPAACALAVQRMRSDKSFFEAVQRDDRKQPLPSS